MRTRGDVKMTEGVRRGDVKCTYKGDFLKYTPRTDLNQV